MVEPVDLVEDRLFDGLEKRVPSLLPPFDPNPRRPGLPDTNRSPIELDDPDDYTIDPGPTLTMSGPEDGGRSADGLGGARAVG